MGATRDSGRGVARMAVAVVFAALAAGMSQGHAQQPPAESAGPVVEIVGDGGEIRVAGAHVDNHRHRQPRRCGRRARSRSTPRSAEQSGQPARWLR